jgi:hypothetical protein
MKQMKNKGQGAMEYLMTYGWAILVVMIVGVVLWQLGVFNVGQGNVVTTGWSKLQPISASIALKANDATFESTFQNTIGTSIRITSVDMEDSVAPVNCTGISIKGTLGTPGATEGDPTTWATPVSVKAGDGFELTATCGDGTTREEGDPYDAQITIVYTAVMGGVSTDHTETGHIRGPAEA